MKLSDRYILSSASSSGSVILPITNLTSLWFERMFYWIVIISDFAPGFLGIAIVLALFTLPFYARFAIQNALSEGLDFW
jgi:ABC-type dipeptide/oligopeptide/nickel transport system permease subunit